MENSHSKPKPYVFHLTNVNSGFAGGKDMSILNYARDIFYAARHDKCTYEGNILGVPVLVDGSVIPTKIARFVELEHRQMRAEMNESPYGKWLNDFEKELSDFTQSKLLSAIEESKNNGTMLPLIEWHKEAVGTQTVINDFIEKHQDALPYARILFNLELNNERARITLFENGFPSEKEVYENLRDRGQIPERELAEKFIGASLMQMPIVNKQRFESLTKSYRQNLSATDAPAPSEWLTTLSVRPLTPKFSVALDRHTVQERLFPGYDTSRGHDY